MGKQLTIANVAFVPEGVILELSDGDEIAVGIGDSLKVCAGILAAGARCLQGRTQPLPGVPPPTFPLLLEMLLESVTKRARDLLIQEPVPSVPPLEPAKRPLTLMKGGKDEP